MGSKKKALLVCGLSLFAATALAGCAGDEPTPSESVSGGETSASTPASSSEQEASSEKGIDMEKFPNYVEDIENLAYSFGEKEMLKLLVKKTRGTDIELLLKESGLIE